MENVNLKMEKDNLKLKKRYWVMGGVIWFVVGIVYWVAQYTPCDFILPNGFNGCNPLFRVDTYISLVEFVIVGIFLGWLYGKIKNRKSSVSSSSV